MTEFESDTDAVLARSGFYRLLARIFRAEPDEALMGQIVAPPLSEALAEAGIDMAAILPAAPMGDIIRALAEEYTRLFLGPGKHISPHESVQLKRGSGVLWGPETGIVKRFIGEAGFDYDETYHANARKAGDDARLQSAIGWQHRFVSKHPGKWVAIFARKVKAEADLPFYPAFAGLLPGFLATEKSILGTFLSEHGLLGRRRSSGKPG
jgi:TorA maturation chaperone TorD